MFRTIIRFREQLRCGAYTIGLVACGSLNLTSTSAQAPTFVTGPSDGVASVGESFELSASVSGTTPVQFVWSVGGAVLTNAVGPSLKLTNLSVANTGLYQLTASNGSGSVTTNVTLIVSDAPARTVYVGQLASNAGIVRVPIRFRPNGVENSVSFSLHFDTNVLSEPAFEAAVGIADSAEPVNGAFGATVRLAAGTRFSPSEPTSDTLLGSFRFKLAEGQSPWSAKLGFSNQPVPLGARTETNSPLVLGTNTLPQIRRVDPLPALSRQTGLFHQRVEVINATASDLANINLLILELKADSLTNSVAVYNAVAAQRTDTDADGDADLNLGLDCVTDSGAPCEAGTEGCRCGINPDINDDQVIDLAPLISINDLRAGEVRELLLEYFVPDLVSVPHPRYSFQPGSPISVFPSARNTPVTIRTNGVVDGRTMLGFRTTPTNRYFIQYASTSEGFSKSNEVKTARPAIRGNGSQVQWIDYGPPKTDPLTNGQRFYRLLEGF